MSENFIRVGRDEKGDLVVEISREKSGGLRVNVQSSVLALYGEKIERTVMEMLQELGIQHATVSINDHGALDFVIRARMEAAARQLAEVKEIKTLPIRQRATVKDRLRRTRLYIPGNNPDLMINAGLFCADCIILDLEDSVAPAEKFAARILVRWALQELDFGNSERIVRINPLSSPFGKDDLEMIVPALPDTLLIPKCEAAADILEIEKIVEQVEKRNQITSPIYFMPLIESAKGVLHAYEIATATARNVALCFGAEDFSADIGVERTAEGRESFMARSLIVLAAKSAGIQALDTVFSDVQDVEGLVASTREALSLGFDGKGVIHPAQIKPIHQVFSPTVEQIEKARQIVQALKEAQAKGLGVVALGTKMIDAPVAARAEKILARAKALGLLPEPENG